MSALETLIVCILVGLLAGIVTSYHQKMTQEAKEVALREELGLIRKAVTLYAVLQGRFPGELGDLVEAQYMIPLRDNTSFKGEYLSTQATDSQGALLDPFGKRYRYDPRGGAVSSVEEGYETW